MDVEAAARVLDPGPHWAATHEPDGRRQQACEKAGEVIDAALDKPVAWLIRETFKVGRPRVIYGKMYMNEDTARAAVMKLMRGYARRTYEAFPVYAR